MTKIFTCQRAIVNLYKKSSRKSEIISQMLYGENSAINLQHGPAHMLKNSKDFEV